MTTDSTPTGGPLRVMLVYGTRPEAIKLAPLVAAMRDDERFNPIVVVTGQHREMLDQVHEFFGIVPDDDLDIHSPGQTLTQITNRCLQGVGQAIEAHRPDAVVVQGDTTSASPPRWRPSTTRSQSSTSRPACAPGTSPHPSPRRPTGGSSAR